MKIIRRKHAQPLTSLLTTDAVKHLPGYDDDYALELYFYMVKVGIFAWLVSEILGDPDNVHLLHVRTGRYCKLGII